MLNRIVLLTLLTFLVACAPEPLTDLDVNSDVPDMGGGADMATGPVEFKDVAVILRGSCATFDSCHGSANSSSAPRIANARMATDEDVRAGIEGAMSAGGMLLIKPGDSAGSHLVARITDPMAGPSGLMPLGQPALSAAQVALIKRWIDEGANYTTPTAGSDMGAADMAAGD
jgi:hypothetical protein